MSHRISYLALDGTTRVLAEWSQNTVGHLTIHEHLDDTSGGDRRHGRLGRLLTYRFVDYDQFNYWRAVILRDPDAQAYEINSEVIVS